ncbi:PadR family transcriptional regulator [Kribbella sp. CA-294648]|uniref:PadR family transcriptional regulator n=1 Tax=Kribbella sp. CA-294648 TaxID=3239948 RepID=UPI003D9163A4
MYPSLLRLEKQGLVQTEWVPSATGPRRKYYDLTAAGHDAVAERIGSWHQFRDAVDSLAEQVQGSRVERSK